jgi:hypothetical protein
MRRDISVGNYSVFGGSDDLILIDEHRTEGMIPVSD